MAVLLILFPTFVIYAQEETLTEKVTEAKKVDTKPMRNRPDFWISLGFDTAFYNTAGLTSGGGLALGYGSGSSIGLKASFFFNEDKFRILEMDLLLRFYFFGKDAYRGPFVQLIGGTALINYSDSFAIPSSTGVFNAGLGFGWRFLHVTGFFVEPVVRLGYPYFLGLGVSAGIRF